MISQQAQEVLLTCFQSDDGKAKEIPLEIGCSPNISTSCAKVFMIFKFKLSI